MSFRYTNNLIGVLKHRLLIESAHREIARRQFVGRCKGVEVVCSGYGTVLTIRLQDKQVWEPFYRTGSLPVVDSLDQTPAGGALADPNGGQVDLAKLAESIKAALWEATGKIRAAKEAALHRSLSHNPRLQAMGSLTQWYEEDANTLRPVAFEALRHEAATRWMQFVQFGKVRQASDLLQREGSGTGAADGPSFSGPTTAQDEPNGDETPIARALEAADCNPSAIPIGSVHPLFAPGLIQLEDSRSGFVNDDFLRREQRHELARDEQLFWERVELIRKGQVATIGNKPKRCYADEAEVEKSNIDEKIQLRFTK